MAPPLFPLLMSSLAFIDTHCHLDGVLKRLKLESYAELKRRYFPPELAACVTISCDPHSIEPVLELMNEDGVYGSFGIHPHDAKDYTPDVEARIAAALRHPKCVAYGEIGLDYHYDYSPRDVQMASFRHQIAIGIAAGKPLVIHTREAEADTLAVMQETIPRDWPMHVHCFTSSVDLAENLLQGFSNLYIGFTGIVTFKNSDDVRAVASRVPLERMLVETDAPYLAPEPFRGQAAHPGHIPRIIERLAEVKQKSVEETAAALLKNARAFYGIRD
jgi:TatD DNase family protein